MVGGGGRAEQGPCWPELGEGCLALETDGRTVMSTSSRRAAGLGGGGAPAEDGEGDKEKGGGLHWQQQDGTRGAGCADVLKR